MTAVALSSTALVRIAYDEREKVLAVAFHDGSVFGYLGVPCEVYRELLEASSHGGYFNKKIRNCFASVRVESCLG